MQELTVQFMPADGTASRPITLRIGTPVMPQEEDQDWSVSIEVQGFAEPFAKTLTGTDWAQSLEFAAKILPVVLENMVEEAGGGTLDPPFYEREIPDPSNIPPDIAAILNAPS